MLYFTFILILNTPLSLVAYTITSVFTSRTYPCTVCAHIWDLGGTMYSKAAQNKREKLVYLICVCSKHTTCTVFTHTWTCTPTPHTVRHTWSDSHPHRRNVYVAESNTHTHKAPNNQKVNQAHTYPPTHITHTHAHVYQTRTIRKRVV